MSSWFHRKWADPVHPVGQILTIASQDISENRFIRLQVTPAVNTNMSSIKPELKNLVDELAGGGEIELEVLV